MEGAMAWAETEFGSLELGDARRTKRIVGMAAKMAENPDKGLPTQMGTWAAAKAAYRLFSGGVATLESITAAHRSATIRSAATEAGPVLFIHDDTEMDLTMHNAMEGRGRIGNDKGFGLIVHGCLAARPDGSVLGLADVHAWARTGEPKTGKETRTERAKRRTEADVWAECLARIGPCPEGRTFVAVADRGSDVFSYFDEARKNGWHVLSRVRGNERRTEGGRLIRDLRALPKCADGMIKFRDGGKFREVATSIAWMEATILPACNRRDGRSPVRAWGIRVWNLEEEIEWLLLSTLPVDSEAAAMERIDWYCRRWMIEEFHKVLKTGCRIEARQLRSAERFLPALGLACVISVRLLAACKDVRADPDSPHEEPEETVAMLSAATKVSKEQLVTRRDFWRTVARLGGFLARKSDGEPGWRTIWDGWSRLAVLLRGAELAATMQAR